MGYKKPIEMRFITLSIVLVLVVVVVASGFATSEKIHYNLNEAQGLFEQFKKDNNRHYKDDADRDAHYHAFVANLEEINQMNELDPSATYGINKFADYTEDEKKQMFGFRPRTE